MEPLQEGLKSLQSHLPKDRLIDQTQTYLELIPAFDSGILAEKAIQKASANIVLDVQKSISSNLRSQLSTQSAHLLQSVEFVFEEGHLEESAEMLAFKVNKSVAQFALSNDVDSIVKQLIENHVNQCEVIIADMIKTVRDTVETVLLKEINEKLKNYPTQSSNTSEPAISKVPLPPRPLVKSQTDPENNMAPPPPNTDLKPQRDVEIPVLPPKPPARTDLNLKSEIEPDSSVPKPTDVSEHEDTEIEQSAPPKPPVRADLVADGPPKPPNRTDLVAEPSLSTSPPKPPARTDIETVKLAEPDVSAIQENVVAKQKSKQELNAAAEVITTKKSTEDLKSLKSKSSNDLVGGKVEKTPSKNSLGSSNNLAADPSPAKKKGGFGSGFKSMLNHITKGRPKPKRKEDEDSAKEPVEVVHTEEPVSLAEPVENSNSTDPHTTGEPEIEQQKEDPTPPSDIPDSIPQNLPEDPTVAQTSEPSEAELITPKKFVPNNAMTALATAMKAALHNTEESNAENQAAEPLKRASTVAKSEKIDVDSTNDTNESGSEVPRRTSTIQSVPKRPSTALKPRPSTMIEPESQPPAPAPKPRPVTMIENPSASIAPEESPKVPILPVRPTIESESIQTEAIPTPSTVVPSPATSVPSRNASVHVPQDRPTSMISAESGEEGTEETKRIPGVFAHSHGALGALANAMKGRESVTTSTPPIENTEGEEEYSMPLTKEEEARMELARQAEKTFRPTSPKVAPPPLLSKPLNLRKNVNSTSGDDAALEKRAIDWLNLHLKDKSIEVTDLCSSLSDGLNLIYALEDCTGQSVGKYNKRAIMAVHKLDNVSVALQFLDKNGVNTHFLTSRDILDGNKSKILSLFNYILMKYA